MTVETDQGLLDTVCICIEHGEPNLTSSTQRAYTSRLASTARRARHSMYMHRAF